MVQKLIMEEREQIAQFFSLGLSQAEIGRRLGRHRSTIGRELRRNSKDGEYWPSRAQQQTQARRSVRPKKLDDPASGDRCARACLSAGRRSRSPVGSSESILMNVAFAYRTRRSTAGFDATRIAAGGNRCCGSVPDETPRKPAENSAPGPTSPGDRLSWTSGVGSATGKGTRWSGKAVAAAWSRWWNAKAASR